MIQLKKLFTLSYQALSGCEVVKVSHRFLGPSRQLPSLPSSGWS